MNIKTLPEVADLLGIKQNTLRLAAQEQRIPATKSGGTWLIDLDDPKLQTYRASLQPRERQQKLPACPVCGKTVPRKRAKYCSQRCYTLSHHPEQAGANTKEAG